MEEQYLTGIIRSHLKAVVTTPMGVSVVFTCTYQLTIDVADKTYSVSGASVVDTEHYRPIQSIIGLTLKKDIADRILL